MAANIISAEFNIKDDGNLTRLKNEAKALNKEVKELSKQHKIGGSGAAAIANDQADYRTTRGITGQTGAAGRDFAKQAQGLGGLVHLYATFAANIFAVSAAFMMLDRAFQYEKMIEGAKVLEATTGVALRSIASNMVKVSDGALSMQESLKFSALASAAGISSKNIDALTKVAKGAALALGRDMGDSIDRIIRGVSKLEPELVDELGITVKSMQAYKDYAKSLGVAVDSLTSYQKTAAYTLAVIKEGTTKFGDVAKSIEASPFNKFIGELKNAGIELLNILNTTITPILKVFANNIELVFAGILLTVKSLAVRAIPELTKMFSVSPEAIVAQEAQIAGLLESIEASNASKLIMAAETAKAEVLIQEEKIAKLKALAIQELNIVGPKGFKNQNGQAAKNLREAGSIDGLKLDPRVLVSTIKGGVTRETKLELALTKEIANAEKSIVDLTKQQLLTILEVDTASNRLKLQKMGATKEQRVLNIQEEKRIEILKQSKGIRATAIKQLEEEVILTKEQLNLSRERLTNLHGTQKLLAQHNLELAGETEAQKRLLAVQIESNIAIQNAAAAKKQLSTNTAAQNLLLQHQLSLAKLNRDQAVQTALFTEGKQRAELVRAEHQLLVDKARLAIAAKNKYMSSNLAAPVVGPNNIRIVSLEVNALGAAYVRLGIIMDGLKAKAITLGATISKAMGTLGIIVMVLYSLYAATKFVLNSFDMLNKHSADLSDALKDNENILHTATAAYTKYSELQKQTGYSTRAIIDSNTIAANTFDQVTESISKQVDAFKTWQANQTTLSAWWDQAFGTSNFDKLKENLANDLTAAAKYSPALKDNLTKGANEVRAATNIEQLTNLQVKYNSVLFKASETLKNTSASYKSLGEGVKDAGIALDTFYKKTDVKNENIRKVVSFIKDLKETKDIKIQLMTLAQIDPASSLFKLAPKALQDIIELQKDIEATEERIIKLKEQSAALDIVKIDPKSLSFELGESFGKWVAKIGLAIGDGLEAAVSIAVDLVIKAVTAPFKKFEDSVKSGGIFKAMLDFQLEFIKSLAKLFNPATLMMYAIGKSDFVSGMATGRDNEKDKHLNERLKAEKLAKEAPQDAESKRLKDAMATFNTTEAAKSENIRLAILKREQEGNKKKLPGLYDEIDAKARALDKKDKQGSGADNAKLALQDQLKLYKAIESQLSLNNKLEEKHTGYISVSNIDKLYANKMAQEDIQYAIEKMDVEKAAVSAGKNKLLTINGIKISENAALQSIEMARDVRKQTLIIEKDELKTVQKLKEYQATVTYGLEQELLARERSLELRIASNTISEIGIREQTDANKLEKLHQEYLTAKAANADAGSSNTETMRKEQEAIDKYRHESEMQLSATIQNNLKDNLKILNNRLDIISTTQEILDKGYPDAQLSKALILKKYENERLKIQHEYEISTDKTVLGSKDLLNTKLALLKVEERIALHEQNKKIFGSLSTAEKAQTVYDEASKQAADFARSMKDTVTGTFDAVYAGMDAAIDELTTKWMKSESVSIKDLITTFRNTAAEEFRKLAADQLKLGMRTMVKDAMGGIAGIFGIKLAPSAEELANEAAKASISMLDKTDVSNEILANLQVISETSNQNLKALVDIAGGVGVDVDPNKLKTGAQEKAEEAAKTQEEIGDKAKGAAESTKGFFNKITEGFNAFFGPEGSILNGLSWVGSQISGIFKSILDNITGSNSSSDSGGILGTLFSLGASYFSGGSSGAMDSGAFADMQATNMANGFANGGIMTEYGALKLNKYAKGGIANSPQLALYGEGKTPEAYVPLPDGRSIPVTMQGNGNTSAPVNISIVVNASTGEATTQAAGTNSNDARQLGVMISNVVKQEIINQQRSGGLLNRKS